MFGTVGLKATRACVACGAGAEDEVETGDGLSAFTWTYAGFRMKMAQAAATKMTTRQSNSQKFVLRVVVAAFFERDG